MERERERERGSGERGRTGEVERVPVRRPRIGECRDSSDEKAAMLKQESQPMSERNNESVHGLRPQVIGQRKTGVVGDEKRYCERPKDKRRRQRAEAQSETAEGKREGRTGGLQTEENRH